MKKRDMWNRFRRKTAALLICALAFQNMTFAFADTAGTAAAAEREAEQSEQGAFPESGNTSFVSFPSRFSDQLPEGYEEQFHVFTLDSVTDISISVESDDRSCQYGAELLDSSFSSLSLSRRKTGQRITEKGLPAGTYFLRVFPLSENTWEPYAVSIQKLKLSAQEVRKTDFSEMHMVAALQGDGSPYRMNGIDPNYAFVATGSNLPRNYQWYRLDDPKYDGRGVNFGGTYPMPQSYYASWLGPVAEEDHPMSGVKDFTGKYYDEYLEYLEYLQTDAIAYREADPQIHVQNAIALPVRYIGYDEDGEGTENPGWEAHIKAGIMNYGALTTGIYWSGLNCEDDKNYYYSGWDYATEELEENSVTGLKNMLSEKHYQNHEVVVVGWDDDYSRENFRYYIDSSARYVIGYDPESEATCSVPIRATASDAEGIGKEDLLDYLLPERDGAWIIRNSWGTGSGDDGYYYVSYCDKQLFGSDNTWAYTATETTGNYNKLYEVTSLPYTRENNWVTEADYLMESTVFTADEDGADALKAVNFALVNNNVHYEIAVNQGEDIGKGWLEDHVYASGSKLYAGYYTVRLDKAVILEPGEPFEIILKIQGDGNEPLTIPFVTNGYYIANIPQEDGICRLYDPAEGDAWIDIGEGYTEDNGSNNYYGYFAIKAMCEDASLEEGETERITALTIDPDTYFALIDDPDQEEDTEDEEELEEETTASVSSASRIARRDEGLETSGGLMLQDGHVLQRRMAQESVSAELPEPDTVLPESFDLREEGVLTPVKDQAATNTCWSFGSTAAVESSYLLNGSNLYDFNYSSGISLETKLPLTKEGTVVYRFNKDQPESLEQALFLPKLLAWDEGPIEDAGGSLRWELSGDLSAVDVSGFQEETGGTGLTGNGEEIMLFTPEESGLLTVRVSAADDPTKTASCRVLLLEENAVDRITVSPEELRLRAGQTHQLEVGIEAPEGSEVRPIFSSDNPNIAAVDDRGLVLGVGSGTTVIRVRAGGEEAVCKVTVWKPGRSTGDDSDRDIGYSGSNSPVRGNWTRNPDGSWSFSAGNTTYRNAWGYIYNPYGNQNAGEGGWFRFDEEGRMLTGWFRDGDGSWYYLNPVSDGSLGKMLTGWQWITDASGRSYCYYFRTDTEGTIGSMVSSGMTPDGYEVDAEGRWCVNGVPQTQS